jgi:hypothetical protein
LSNEIIWPVCQKYRPRHLPTRFGNSPSPQALQPCPDHRRLEPLRDGLFFKWESNANEAPVDVDAMREASATDLANRSQNREHQDRSCNHERRHPHMKRNRSSLAFLCMGLTGVLLLLTRAASQNQNPDHHTPPWRSPVASTQTFTIAGATLQVDYAPGSLDLPTPQILQWVKNAATAVATYYGRFPVPRDRILIVPAADRHGVFHGTTWGGVGGWPAFTRIAVGQHSTVADLTDDWMMTHELTHTGLPSQDDNHHWLEEGLAVYVEPVARVQAGFLTPEKIWADMVRDMPKGNPQPGDQGLDNTPTWGRTYWGGAQFCLLADVAIREQTHNRKGLQDALRAIVASGGAIDQDWSIEKTLAAGDAGTGTHVLEEQYKRMASAPVTIDLDALWKKLGVIRTGDDQVRFDDSAPDAVIRKAITATPASGIIHPSS